MRAATLTACGAVTLVACWGLIDAAVIRDGSRGRFEFLPHHVFHRLFAWYEPPFLWTLAAFALAVPALHGAASRAAAAEDAPPLPGPSRWAITVVAIALGLACRALGHAVAHDYPLSMDEYAATFQAQIFAAGRPTAPAPAAWGALAWPMTPIFINQIDGSWVSSYSPVYAALRAAFLLLHAAEWTNPALAAISVPLIAAVSRRLWPSDGRREWLAIALLASSTQVLYGSTTSYAMPAHLAANLLWLWLFLRGDARSFAALIAVGMLALGLHRPPFHALFAAPFFALTLARGQLRRALVASAFYLVALYACWRWNLFARPDDAPGDVPLSALFGWPRASSWDTLGRSLGMFLTWQTPLLAVFGAAGTLRALRERGVEMALAAGVVLTFGFFLFFVPDQGHGWGYRYAHPVLGSFALLGALAASDGLSFRWRRAPVALAAASAAVTLLLQLPMRALEVGHIVMPFGCASKALAALPSDLVIVDLEKFWYGPDLLRNDPSLRSAPRLLRKQRMGPAQDAELQRRVAAGQRALEAPAALLDGCGLVRIPGAL